MNNLIELLTSKEILVVYGVTAFSFTLYFAISLIDKFSYKRKRRNNTRELNRLVEDINKQIGTEEVIDQKEEQQVPILIETYQEPEKEMSIISENDKDVVKNQEVTIDCKNIEVQNQNLSNLEINTVNKEETTENIKEVEQLLLKSTELEEQLPLVEETEKLNNDEQITYTEIEPDKTTAQLELKKLTDELEKAAESQQNINLTSFEEQQEKDAIISLEELLKRSKELYESNEITQYEDDDAPISLADLERKLEEAQTVLIETEETLKEAEIENLELSETIEPIQEKLILDDFNTVDKEPKIERPVYQKFVGTPVISPVYGIERQKSIADIELENTANYEKLDEEIKKTNEFLMTLKELQKNLE